MNYACLHCKTPYRPQDLRCPSPSCGAFEAMKLSDAPAGVQMVTIDTAPLVNSPESTGTLRTVQVLHETLTQYYVIPPNGSPLYVNKMWERRPRPARP